MTASGESTAIGIVPRARESSFGHRVVDLISSGYSGDTPSLSSQARENAAALVDAATEQALAAARTMATADATSLRGAQRWLLGAVFGLCFAVVGVVLWSVVSRLDTAEVETRARFSRVESTQAATDEEREAAAEHRAKLDANVKTLAGHAVALTEAVNQSAQTNFDVLTSIATKVKAPIPESAQRPETIEAPVTLRYIAGER